MSDIYTRLVANALFPLQERLKKHDTVKVRQAMEVDRDLVEAELFVVAGQAHAVLHARPMRGEIELR